MRPLPLIALCIFAASASSIQAQTIRYVDGDAPLGGDGSSWSQAFNYLQDALSVAGVGDEIRVAEGIHRPDEDAAHPSGTDDRAATFQLSSGVAIYGGYAGYGEPDPDIRDRETILSGEIGASGNSDNSDHVVTASGTDATALLDGFTITDGNAIALGGGMYNDHGSPTLNDCVFTENSAAVLGGGMYNDGSSPTLTNCTFDGNSATNPGGGGMYNDHGSPTLSDCMFIRNTAEWRGGGMYSENGSSPTLTNCTFDGNSAAGQDGGGMYNQESSPTLGDCMFIRNTAERCGGGATFCECSTATLINCTFNGNSATTGDGGGMYNSASSPTLTNCTFTGNSAGQSGGGVRNYEYSSVTVTNCTFSANSASDGGAIYSGDVSVGNCILWGNSPDQVEDAGSSAWVSYSDIQGGWLGMGNIDAHPRFVRDPDPGPDYTWGTSDDDYGDLRLRNGAPGDSPIDAGDNTRVPVDIMTDLDGNPRFGDDPDTPDSGYPYMDPPYVDMGAYEYTIWYVDVSAPPAGDGRSWATAFNDLQDALEPANSDNQIWVAAGTYTPDRGTGDREATFQLIEGAALYGAFPPGGGSGTFGARNVTNPACETTLSGDLDGDDLPPFGNNDENSYHVVTGSGTAERTVLDGFTIAGGNADGTSTNAVGGGMLNDPGSPTLAHCTFRENSAVEGGGIFNYIRANPKLTNCAFSGNRATGPFSEGGGMSNWTSDPTLVNCTFTENSADMGGGMSNWTSSPTITECTFTGNGITAGGGIFTHSGSPQLTKCSFYANIATEGGGMYNYSDGTPRLVSCVFGGNMADTGGGAYNYLNSSPTLINCVFSGNSANDASGMYNDRGCTPTIINCTFSLNSAVAGGGMWNSGTSSPVVTNCIFWDNSPEQFYDEDSAMVVTYSDVEGGWPGTGNINLDPHFLDADGPDNAAGNEDDDLRLRYDSPCIDEGNNAALPPDILVDFGSLPRIVDGDGNGPATVDMGAHEYQTNGTRPIPSLSESGLIAVTLLLICASVIAIRRRTTAAT